MDKFKIVRPARDVTKSQFMTYVDSGLQEWVREVAHDNGVSISETMEQIIRFAKKNHSKGKS